METYLNTERVHAKDVYVPAQQQLVTMRQPSWCRLPRRVQPQGIEHPPAQLNHDSDPDERRWDAMKPVEEHGGVDVFIRVMLRIVMIIGDEPLGEEPEPGQRGYPPVPRTPNP